MQGLGWGERERMAVDVKFSLDVERSGLQHIHQIVRHSTEKHIQRLDTLDVQSSLDVHSKALTGALWVLKKPSLQCPEVGNCNCWQEASEGAAFSMVQELV